MGIHKKILKALEDRGIDYMTKGSWKYNICQSTSFYYPESIEKTVDKIMEINYCGEYTTVYVCYSNFTSSPFEVILTIDQTKRKPKVGLEYTLLDDEFQNSVLRELFYYGIYKGPFKYDISKSSSHGVIAMDIPVKPYYHHGKLVTDPPYRDIGNQLSNGSYQVVFDVDENTTVMELVTKILEYKKQIKDINKIYMHKIGNKIQVVLFQIIDLSPTVGGLDPESYRGYYSFRNIPFPSGMAEPHHVCRPAESLIERDYETSYIIYDRIYDANKRIEKANSTRGACCIAKYG